jgi:hypothetical protein
VGGTGVSVGGLEVLDAVGVGDTSSTWTAVVQEVIVNKMSKTNIFLDDGLMFKKSLTFFNLRRRNGQIIKFNYEIQATMPAWGITAQ